jgi:hypothetical protein
MGNTTKDGYIDSAIFESLVLATLYDVLKGPESV